ncbi:MAG: ATP-grasp domain-containing protein [Gemmatimonadota bacterium]|nr:ATP-grasp domain-containing protein [Gemmatimonadota bacterium]MDH3368152.1 ATP-grasp domain-containing protein [Gemmatimonadota bacterium]MDH3477983.1 ATP-grasp domain-containing protein [Gemmatimonadota bacterium]MDH3570261.1 ATP-grasp domain-containing protein [Gemmatimonadota bacterium]MDH5549035.1 ATP-grasp domain-containing protein [Gemmatimonadota bacterium]
MSEPQPSVVVLFNHTGEDEYERLEHVDPASLDFEPEYDIRVTTVLDEYKAVARALRREGYRARLYNVREDLGRLERLLRRNPPDVIFNLIEHFHDDAELEPSVAALFDLHEVAYTGAAPFALSFCHKKGLTKQLLLQNGVPTPRFVAVKEPRLPKRSKLKYPVIVKPAREDASSGVERESVVFDEEQLQARLQYVYDEYGIPILVEEFIDGEELHVPILGNDPPEVLPPIAWDFTGLPEGYPHIITFAAKWNPLSEAYHRVHSVCPPDLPKRMLRKVEEVSLQAYEVTGCRDYARVDVRIGKDGNAYVLEINPNPDLTEGVSYMESAEVAGHTFAEILAMIVDMALERKEETDEARRLRLERQKQKREPVSPEGLRASLQRLDDKAEEKTRTAAGRRKKAKRKTKQSDK